MNIHIHEHVCASPPTKDIAEEALFAEGRAMLCAAGRELSAVKNVVVSASWHPHRPVPKVSEFQCISPELFLSGSARRYDAVLCIAPEWKGVAERLAERCIQAGNRLLGPTPRFIRWAADKRHYSGTEEQYPGGMTGLDPASVVVVKPCDGVGGLLTWKGPLHSLDAIKRRLNVEMKQLGLTSELLVQPFYHGVPVSIGVLARRNQPPIFLPAVLQVINLAPVAVAATEYIAKWSDIVSFEYAGGVLPWTENGTQNRMERLGQSIVDLFPEEDGYFGVDAVLHPTDEHSDVVLDVNPRLTTSFLGYSDVLPGIIGRLMLNRNSAEDVSAVRDAISAAPRQFYVDGRVEWVRSKSNA